MGFWLGFAAGLSTASLAVSLAAYLTGAGA